LRKRKGRRRKEMVRNDEECVSYGGRNSWTERTLQERRERRNEKVDREKWSILEHLDRVILSLLSFCLRTEEHRRRSSWNCLILGL
jgi:hypothetical protein